MYNKSERKLYNQYRESVCNRLNLTKTQYNYLRRIGQAFRKLFENNCNGYVKSESLYCDYYTEIEIKLSNYIKKNNLKSLYYFIQSDPRGSSLYFDYEVIPDNNYTKALSIY